MEARELVAKRVWPENICTGCSDAWDLTATISDSDCPSETQELPLFVSMTGLAIGAVPADIQASMPLEGINAGSYIAYDDSDWQAHGWALEPDGQSPWAGGDTINLWPAFTWDLESL